MALRDQPYLPLYVQDFLTDEKLMECSASATGIYIKIMCILHKQNEYGVFLLKQKYKQSDKQVLNFACQLAKFLPFNKEEIFSGLNELVEEGVLKIEEDKLFQKRMVKDNELSIKRAEAGKKGGEKTQFAKAKTQANSQANTEYEYEYVNENINEIYNKYPTKCSIKDRSTGKTYKDKEKIKKLLKKHSKEEIIKKIDDYVKECYNTNTYLKNFGTFLNNLPDYVENNEEDLATKVVKVFQGVVDDYVIMDMQREREYALKLIKAYKSKHPESLDEELLESMRVFFDQVANIDDGWIQNNLTLSLIVKNFNPINQILKNGTRKGKPKQGVSQEYWDGLLKDLRAYEGNQAG